MKRTNHRPPSSGNSGSGASIVFTCNGGCARPVPEAIGTISYCGTCWKVRAVLIAEKADTLHELARRGCPRERSVARIADLIRRSGVDDAEDLIGQLRLR